MAARPESDVPRDDEFSAGPYDLSTPPDWEAFPGLYPPLYTQTPDVFFDWVAPFLPEIELRVLLYLIRRTLGFKKQGDQITVEQIACGIVTREGLRLDWGAQLGERSVQRALSGLEAKCLIERHRQLDPERGWRPSYIRLRLCDQDGQIWAGRGRQAPPPGVSLDARGVSVQSPASRTTRHLPGVQGITSDHRAPSVQPDTYNKQRSHSTDQQETVPASHRQETETRTRQQSGGLWDAIKEELAALLAPSVYQTRVAPTRQIALDTATLTVCCTDAPACRWLEHRLGRMIAEIAAGLTDEPPAIRFTTPD